MALPTSSFSAELLLIVSFFFLGIWSSTFKLAGNRWRFELFSFDFAVGAILLALVSAYAFGELGAELGFAERLMIASKVNQALAFIAGGLFALGAMLLLSGTALLGLAFSYALAAASAVLVLAVVDFTDARFWFLGSAIAAALLAIFLESMGAKSAEKTLPAVSLPVMGRVRKSSSGRTIKPTADTGSMKSSSKGIITSILSGLALGATVSPFFRSVFGQFGLGSFAGNVVFFSGALSATVVLSFLFMNIPIHGGPTNLKAYLRGTALQHLLGLLGGALCAAGILILTLLNAFPNEIRPDPLWLWLGALGAALLTIALGLGIWHELTGASGAAIRSLMIGAIFLVLAIGLFAMAMDRMASPVLAVQAALQQLQLFG